jgi:hypothetical protein
MILDNCSSHPNLKLTNIELLFLPPNTTAKLQPLDAGLIRSFKQRYRNQLLNYIIECLESENDCKKVLKKFNLLKAIHFMDSSIKSIPNSVFVNCFRSCGIDFGSDVETIASEEPMITSEEWNQMRETLDLNFDSFESMADFDNNLICRQNLTDEEIIDSFTTADDIDSDSIDIEINDSSECEPIHKIPTKCEALEKIHELRLYLGSLDSADNTYYESLNSLEKLILNSRKTSKQTLITEYYTKDN